MELPFASVADLESKWRQLEPDERTRAGVLLFDASVLVANTGLNYKDVAADSLLGKTMMIVVCEMVANSMKAKIDSAPLTSIQTTAGSYSETESYAYVSGDLYLTDKMLKALGLKKQRIGSIRPFIRGRFGGESDAG